MKRRSSYVPVPDGWLADVPAETTEHSPLIVLFIEVSDPDGDATVWGIDSDGHLICEPSPTARFRRAVQ